MIDDENNITQNDGGNIGDNIGGAVNDGGAVGSDASGSVVEGQSIPASDESAMNNSPNDGELNDEMMDEKTITVQPVQFASFEDYEQMQGPQNQNLNILLDVKLQLTVELGKTELPIKKVLELTKGSIVTLNKAAGEPVELYANGKLIAYGEVVVIEDNFGLRITHITDPAKRLNTIHPNNDS